jgi:hypothetical protein
MDKKTFEALRLLMSECRQQSLSDEWDAAVKQVDGWMDEISKDIEN